MGCSITKKKDMNGEQEDMPSIHVNAILRKAIKTFSSKPELFNKNFQQLATLFNETTSAHVFTFYFNLHPMFMNETTWTRKTKAPMTYIHIFGDKVINVGIFILKPNMTLPLHNHPGMYGLLKVIAGTVKIRSYSLQTERTKKYNGKRNCGESLRLIAEKLDDIKADIESQCAVLDPNLGNIHEIESVDGAAAFIDILSPPYEVDIPGVGERKCSYFTIEKELEPKIFELKEIATPFWFWSDSFPYQGPLFHN